MVVEWMELFPDRGIPTGREASDALGQVTQLFQPYTPGDMLRANSSSKV